MLRHFHLRLLLLHQSLSLSPPKDGTPASYTSRNSVIYSFATQQYTCLQCSTALYGGHCIELVMRNGYGLGHENAWLRRIPCRDGDNQRCDICQRDVR